MVGNFKDNVNTRREALLKFLAGKEHKFEFDIACGVEQRIDFIYSVIFPGLKKYTFYLRFFLMRLAQYLDYSPLKIFLYRIVGMKIGKGVFISPDVVLDPHFPELIEIDDYAIIGWGAQIFSHEFSGSKYYIGRIKIGRGAVIGGLSVIRNGVIIGNNAKIAPVCIVYKDVADNYHLESVVLLNRALIEQYREERNV